MRFFCLAIAFVCAAAVAVADSVTEENVKVLQDAFKSDTPTNEQLFRASEAIRHLTEQGTTEAVEELAKLLPYPQVNTAVRTALVNIPGGVDALRKAATTLNGRPLAAVVETLGNVRDEKSADTFIRLTNDKDPIVVQSVLYALGKLALPNTMAVLSKIAEDKQSPYRCDAYWALMYSAQQLRSSGKTDEAVKIYSAVRTTPYPEIKAMALKEYILLTETSNGAASDGLATFVELLKSNDDSQWKTVLDLGNKLRSPETSKLILANMTELPVAKQAALVKVAGSRKDTSTVEAVIKIAGHQEKVLRVAAVKALGAIGDLRGLDAILEAVDSEDAELSAAGNGSLLLLGGKAFNETIAKLLDAEKKSVRLAALNVIAERRIDEGIEKTKNLFDDSDSAVRIAAYRAFSTGFKANTADLQLLLDRYRKLSNAPESEQMEMQNALRTVCFKIPAREESVTVIEAAFKSESVKARVFLLELLFLVGGEKAGHAIAEAAQNTEEAVADKATELLGKWKNSEIAAPLLELAKNHPVEKFRLRALRGYIRIIRQLSGHLTVERRLEMLSGAEPLAQRDADKKLVAETKERLQKMLKGTPIFDGTTFTGWEFRDNEKSFRIEYGAIVGGSMKERNPKNQFVCTTKEYGDFTLRLEAKVLLKEGARGEANGGVQFRSVRTAKDSDKPNEMVGYQADMLHIAKFWGCLYDESRRAKFLAEAKLDEVKQVFRPNDWNELEIVCKGANVKIFVNGVQTVDYTESDANIPRSGVIGLQIHSGPESEAWYRNIRIEE